MMWLIGLISFITSLYTVLAMHPFENNTINSIVFPALSLLHIILISIAGNKEDKINKRIKDLENKINNKGE